MDIKGLLVTNLARLKANLNILKNKKVIFSLVVAVILIIVLFAIVFGGKNRQTQKQFIKTAAVAANENTLDQLNRIEQQLSDLSTELNQNQSSSSDKQAAQISGQLNGIQRAILQTAQTKDINKLQKIISNGNNNLVSRIVNLQKVLNQIKRHIVPIHYLSAKALPFKLISIDIWNGTVYATVSLRGKNDLVGLNETKSGWKLIYLSYESQRAVFRNTRNQLVRVTVH